MAWQWTVRLYFTGRMPVRVLPKGEDGGKPRLSAHGISLPVLPYVYEKGRDKTLWDLSCDIAMEALIDGLYQKCVHVPQSPLRRETYLRLKRYMEEGEHTSGGSGSVLTAERIFRALAHMELPARRLDQLRAEFKVDDHDLWEQEEDPRQAVTRQNQWNDNREKMQDPDGELWAPKMNQEGMKVLRICCG